MGNSSSTGDGANDGEYQYDDDDYEDPFDGIETLGYRVLGVQPDSPASAAGLVSFLDFLVGADNKMLLGSGEDLEPGQEYDDVDLPALLEGKKGKPVELLVWNIKSQTARLVDIIPSDTWGGAGLLGVTIRLDNYAGAEDRLVRVLSTDSPTAPAAIAGLIPEKDFLLGTTHQTLDSVDRLATVLRQNEDEVVELYVYNTDEDMVRVVALLPTSSWEGSRGGLLGAEVGTGYLHRLPYTSRNTSGSSVERKVRYVDVEKTIGDSAKTTTNGKPIKTETKKEVSTKLLEMEPQLEMELADYEDNNGRATHIAPSSVGKQPPPPQITYDQQSTAQQLSETALPSSTEVAGQPSISTTRSFPALIFTPRAQNTVDAQNATNSNSESTFHTAPSPLNPTPSTSQNPTPRSMISTTGSVHPAASTYKSPTTSYKPTSPFASSPSVNAATVFAQPPPLQTPTKLPTPPSIPTSYGQVSLPPPPAPHGSLPASSITNTTAQTFAPLPPHQINNYTSQSPVTENNYHRG